jgi:3-phenylpropionate/cinnamic acid dioxygenase small subunit
MSDAHEAIRNLLGLYCELMDAGDFDALARLFAHARMTDDKGNVFATGSGEIAAMWHRQTILYAGSPRTRHITANPIIVLDPNGTTATVRSSYIVFQGTDEIALRPIITGRYVDKFHHVSGTWRWDERSYAIDHLGDLTGHLKT